MLIIVYLIAGQEVDPDQTDVAESGGMLNKNHVVHNTETFRLRLQGLVCTSVCTPVLLNFVL